MTTTRRRSFTIGLWAAQAVLATIFLMAGVMKLIMPAEDLTKDTALSAEFLRFIGACEVLGALGLLVPGITGIRPQLTPLAAGGLLIIMVGAVTVTLAESDAVLAIWPFAVGVLCAAVMYGRTRVAPHGAQAPARGLRMSYRGYSGETASR